MPSMDLKDFVGAAAIDPKRSSALPEYLPESRHPISYKWGTLGEVAYAAEATRHCATDPP